MLFSAPMVRAILDGRKTQTRRPLTPRNAVFGSAPRLFWEHGDFTRAWVDGKGTDYEYLKVPCHANDLTSPSSNCRVCRENGWIETVHRLYPRWQSGDVIWGRETFRAGIDRGCEVWVAYKADGWSERVFSDDLLPPGWRLPRAARAKKLIPAIHMPRWASRLNLRVEKVRIQRLQDISEEDAIAEGIRPGFDPGDHPLYAGVKDRQHRMIFEKFWDSLNGTTQPWNSNHWVIATTFSRIEAAHA